MTSEEMDAGIARAASTREAFGAREEQKAAEKLAPPWARIISRFATRTC